MNARPTNARIGIDIGGTKIAAGVVTADGEVLATTRRATTRHNYQACLESMAEAVAELVAGADADTHIESAGVGVAGLVDRDRSTVNFAAILDWQHVNLGSDLARLTGLPVVVENDANAAAWGEYRFGAAADAESVVVVALGSGVGGGIIVNGRLWRGAHGLAAEIGHLRVVPDGRRCGCGQRGCWEPYGSGSALVREAQEMAAVAPSTAMHILSLAGGQATDITGQHVTEAARQGDPTSQEAFATIGTWLGKELAELAAVIDPEVFVIAGGVSEAGDLVRSPATQAYLAHLTGRFFREPAPLRLATLGNEAGWIGAADLSADAA